MRFLFSAVIACITCVAVQAQSLKSVYLDEIDLTSVTSGWKVPQPRAAVDNDSIIIAKKYYPRGVGTHASCLIDLNLFGTAERFTAEVGLDDKIYLASLKNPGSAEAAFYVVADNDLLFSSGVMKAGMPAKKIDLNIKGRKRLFLWVDEINGSHHDHVDWADAKLTYSGKTPEVYTFNEPKLLRTPKTPEAPQYNGPLKYGCSAGKPVLFRLPFSGQRPMNFSAVSLPKGLNLNTTNGVITGSLPSNGRYKIKVNASNAIGTASAELVFEAGSLLCLTPPLGWNSWNGYGMSITGAEVVKNARMMSESGLADFGFAYVNIDDGWQLKRGSDSVVISNQKFPDMKAVADEIHSYGLKAGLYSSPGVLTCGGLIGSYLNEEIDAKTYAKWGYDYLKYDWCSYSAVAKNKTNADKFREPYDKISKALKATDRDIVLSLCQYGMDNVPAWGGDAGGSLWRTTGDIIDGWSSMKPIVDINKRHYKYAKPGNWNDPDMMVVGVLGWGEKKHPSKLTAEEQYYHISMWAMQAAPILLGCDLGQLDDFTKNLLMNREILAINQDTLGVQGKPVVSKGGQFWFTGASYDIFTKPLADGSIAVGFFNNGNEARNIEVNMEQLGLKSGTYNIKDAWRHTVKTHNAPKFKAKVGRHSAEVFVFKKG